MKAKFKVGDIVRFNNNGLEMCFGSTLGLKHMKTKELTITQVDSESMTFPEPTFCVETNDREINKFMIDDQCFDLVRKGV